MKDLEDFIMVWLMTFGTNWVKRGTAETDEDVGFEAYRNYGPNSIFHFEWDDRDRTGWDMYKDIPIIRWQRTDRGWDWKVKLTPEALKLLENKNDKSRD